MEGVLIMMLQKLISCAKVFPQNNMMQHKCDIFFNHVIIARLLSFSISSVAVMLLLLYCAQIVKSLFVLRFSLTLLLVTPLKQ